MRAPRAQRVVFLYRAFGWQALLGRVVRRAAATVFCRRTELVLLKSLAEAEARPHGANELHVEPITPAHGPLLKRFNERHRTPDRAVAIEAYLRNGYDGFLAFRDGTAIGYWWWVGNQVDPALTHPCVERFDLALRDDEVFAFDYFIAPEYRDRGAALKVLSAVYDALAARGYRAVWGAVDHDNLPARWVYRLHGNDVVRRTVGYDVFSVLRFQDRRVFVRNTRSNPTHPFERRLLFARAPRARATAQAPAPKTLSTHGA